MLPQVHMQGVLCVSQHLPYQLFWPGNMQIRSTCLLHAREAPACVRWGRSSSCTAHQRCPVFVGCWSCRPHMHCMFNLWTPKHLIPTWLITQKNNEGWRRVKPAFPVPICKNTVPISTAIMIVCTNSVTKWPQRRTFSRQLRFVSTASWYSHGTRLVGKKSGWDYSTKEAMPPFTTIHILSIHGQRHVGTIA